MTKESDKHELTTSLAGKHYEPLVVRKYMGPYGFPVYISIICGDDLSTLDKKHDEYADLWEKMESRGIQDLRNYFGALADFIRRSFKGVEGVAVIAFADKMVVSSLWGDFMVHQQCRLELFSLIQTTTNV